MLQRDIKVDRIDQPVRRAVVREADREALFGAHV